MAEGALLFEQQSDMYAAYGKGVKARYMRGFLRVKVDFQHVCVCVCLCLFGG